MYTGRHDRDGIWSLRSHLCLPYSRVPNVLVDPLGPRIEGRDPTEDLCSSLGIVFTSWPYIEVLLMRQDFDKNEDVWSAGHRAVRFLKVTNDPPPNILLPTNQDEHRLLPRRSYVLQDRRRLRGPWQHRPPRLLGARRRSPRGTGGDGGRRGRPLLLLLLRRSHRRG